MTRVVVDQLRLATPLHGSTISAARQACAEILAAGADLASMVHVDEDLRV